MSTRVFITGGASGLGRALAERYARDGARVCIGDVNAARLNETAQALKLHAEDVGALHCDVTKETDLADAAAWLRDRWGGVDVVINNAGVAAGGGITETSLDDWRWILDVNVLGVVRGCQAFVPMLRAQRSGRLVNVASMAGLVHPPTMAAYNATKAAVVAISETLRFELAPDNVQVSVVCPSFFRTNLMDNMRAATPDVERVTRRLIEKSPLGADAIAALAHRGIERGDFHILTHPQGKRAWMLKRLAPWDVYERAMAKETRALLGRKRT